MLTLRQLKTIPTPWLGLCDDFVPEPFAGFVYVITEIKSGRRYIGKKTFWFKRRVKVKGKKRKKKVSNESDWKTYKSSSEEVLQGIRKQGIEAFEFRITHLCKTRSQVNFTEISELFKQEVLHSLLPNSPEYAFFNKNILGRYFRGKV